MNPLLQYQLPKITTTKQLRDIFVKDAGYYVPPQSSVNKQFLIDCLVSRKILFKTFEVRFSQQAQNDPELMKYLPDFKGKRVPSRRYILDIINTVNRRQTENP